MAALADVAERVQALEERSVRDRFQFRLHPRELGPKVVAGFLVVHFGVGQLLPYAFEAAPPQHPGLAAHCWPLHGSLQFPASGSLNNCYCNHYSLLFFGKGRFDAKRLRNGLVGGEEVAKATVPGAPLLEQ